MRTGVSERAVEGTEVVIVADWAAVALSAAARIATAIGSAVSERGVAHVALTGGSTPAALYRHLAAPPLRDTIPWPGVQLWWGDDRFVGRDDPLSNVRIADRYLFVGAGGGPGIPIPADRVHPFRCDDAIAAGLDADACAAAYEAELRGFLGTGTDTSGWPVFDLVLVGIGSDGHVLSVFPGSAAFNRREWALGVPAPAHIAPAVPRVTLHPAIVSSARGVLAIVHGAAKAGIVAAIFGPQRDPRRLPAQLAIRAGATWVLDEAAARQIPSDLIGRRPEYRRPR